MLCSNVRCGGGPCVLLLIDHLLMGGAERILTETAPRLAALGLRVRVCILDGEGADDRLASVLRLRGVAVDRVPFPRLLDAPALRRLRDYIRAAAPDVVHTQLERANTLGLCLAKRGGATTVTTLHTVEGKGGLRQADLRRRLENRSVARYADRIVCVSEALREHCRTVWGLPVGRLAVLHNGVDLARFAPPTAKAARGAREALRLPPEARVLMTVAVLRAPKGVEFLLRALPGILESCPEAQYVVVGDG